MLMMGLNENSYYKAWFVMYSTITFFTSLEVTFVLSIEAFQKSDRFLIFSMAFVYASCLFGFGLFVVAVFPNKQKSAAAASLIHLASYYFAFSLKQSQWITKVITAIFIPNCGISYLLDHLLHCDIEGGSGLTFTTANMPYQNFNFNTGILCMLFGSVMWLFLGVYFDKVMPR